LRSRGTETLQHGLGGRVIWSDDQDTSGELVFGVQTFRQGYLLRGTVGFQTFSGELSIRDDSSAFGVGEFTWYGGSNWALGAGLQAESDDTLGAFGFEYKFGTSDFSLSAEYLAAQ